MSPLNSETQPLDAPDVSDTTAPVSRRGWGKHILLSASALAVLFASNKPAEVQAAPPTDTWLLGGNAGADATNFIGPTNSAPFVIKTAGVERMRVTASGNVGIGNASPTAKLLVDVASGVAVYARHTATTGDAPAVRGDTNATVANASGVLGQIITTNPAGDVTGVWGDNKATNGYGSGVRGTHASSGYGVHGISGPSGIGVYGNGGYAGVSAIGPSYGLVAQGSGTSSTGVYASGGTAGVYASSSATGLTAYGNTNGIYASGPTGVRAYSSSGTGVFAESNVSNGVFGASKGTGDAAGVWGKGTHFGVIGKADGTSGENYGVFGSTASSAGFGGYFNGKVQVNGALTVYGTLSKSSGSFKIDHPLDPENKYLYHSFVESPDMMNVYNGNVVTDANGNATVTLPTYFEALNSDFRYQLTPIGQLAQAAVINEIKGNQFTVKTDKPNVKLSWQVTGIRKDAYANAHRIPNEVQKPAAERGRYLHPEVFGKPASLSVNTRRTPQEPTLDESTRPQRIDPHSIRH